MTLDGFLSAVGILPDYSVLGALEEIEVNRNGFSAHIAFSNSFLAVSENGRRLHVVTPAAFDFRLLVDYWRFGWRPWRRELGAVRSVTYRTSRFVNPRGLGYLDKRGGELARRWGSPAYTHVFEGAARVSLGCFGGLWIEGGTLEVEKTRLGDWGMIHG